MRLAGGALILRCPACLRYFDDEFRIVYCPHDTFPANDGRNTFAHHPEAYLADIPPHPRRD